MKAYLSIIISLAILSCKRDNETPTDPVMHVDTETTQASKVPVKQCYLKVNGKDSIKLNFEQQGDSIKGIYHNLPYGIDKRISSFKGILRNNQAHTISTYSAEGQDYVEELIFTLEDNQARLNYGPTEPAKDGVWRYTKNAKISEHIIPKINCK